MAESSTVAPRDQRDIWSSSRSELAKYLCFTVFFSFFPVLFQYLMRAYEGYYMSIPELVQDGGVLAIAIVLTADALGWLIATGKRWRIVKVFLTAGSISALACASVLYALRHVHPPGNPRFFVNTSLALLIVSVAVATFCRLFSGGDV